MRKRAAAILLALCMALTLLPTAAFATEEGGAAAPVEQPAQQEEKQEGQQDEQQPEETPQQPEETPQQPEEQAKEQPEAKPAEQPEQQQESVAQGEPAVQSANQGIALLADEHKHCICGGSVTAGDHTSHSDVAYTAWKGTDSITYTNNVAYVYLTGSATISSHLTVDGKTLYLCLNGKTLSSNDTAKIQIKNGGRLVLCDCQGGGTFKGATQSVWGGACVYLYKSTLDMFGGKLTGGKVHVTDYSNASRTMLFNINTLQWDDEILAELDIPKCMLPTPMPSSCVYGETDPSLLGGPIKIGGAAGDQQSALFGQACYHPGEAKNTYGTGAFLLMNTGEKPVFSKNGLVTTIAWGLDGKVEYALEGSVFVAGAAIQWLRDELKLLESAPDSEYYAGKVKDTNGCYVVPAFTGLGAPHWDQYARGTIVGITRGVNKNHIIRATMESLAYQVNDILVAMQADSGIRLAALNVDGGASANNLLMQMQSDISGAPVQRPTCVETTAMGAAYLAGLAVGYWSNKEDVVRNRAIDRVFHPKITEEDRAAKIKGWSKAVKCAYGWAKDE